LLNASGEGGEKMKSEVREALLSIGITDLSLLERIWDQICDYFMISEEEFVSMIEACKTEFRRNIRNRRGSHVHGYVNWWLGHNKVILKNWGVPELSEKKTRLRADCDRAQLTFLAYILPMHMQWKLGEQKPEPISASDKLAEGGYEPKVGGKLRKQKPSPSTNYKEAKKARFAASKAKEQENVQSGLEQTTEDSESKAKTEALLKVTNDLGFQKKPLPTQELRYEPKKLSLWQRIRRSLGRILHYLRQ
jgi:hypothetical protein